VHFFATGVGAAAATTHERVGALISWRGEALSRVRQAGVSGVAERLAGDLIGAPILTAGQVAKRHNVSHQGGMYALRRLADLGIVVEQTRNGRVTFTARRVVQLLSQ
jgi:hypothetical protein